MAIARQSSMPLQKALQSTTTSNEKLAEQRQAADEASKKREISITDFVASVLRATGRALKDRMWDLSTVCFSSEHARPSNLIGTWDDLDATTQDDVLNVCVAAVRECKPTRFSANSFTHAVQFDAWCFRAVIKQRLSELAVDADLITNWLPALWCGPAAQNLM